MEITISFEKECESKDPFSSNSTNDPLAQEKAKKYEGDKCDCGGVLETQEWRGEERLVCSDCDKDFSKGIAKKMSECEMCGDSFDSTNMQRYFPFCSRECELDAEKRDTKS